MQSPRIATLALAAVTGGWCSGPVRIETNVPHEGTPGIRVTTADLTWIFDAQGGGFASLVDRDGKDWISYRPGHRSAGEFRGIPNLGAMAHPGYTGSKAMATVVESPNRLRSVSPDGRWETVWEFRRGSAELTVVRAGEPYWFLYEGTPHGRLDLERAYWGMADGVRRAITETWNADIRGAEWVYFGDRDSPRVLYLINHQDDDANDQFWQMEGNMTVWGFGREHRCCGKFLTQTPARFTVGFVESTDFETIRRAVEEALRAR